MTRWGAVVALSALLVAAALALILLDEPHPDEAWWYELPGQAVPGAGKNPWQPLLDRWPTVSALERELGVTGDVIEDATDELLRDRSGGREPFRFQAEAADALATYGSAESFLGVRREVIRILDALEAEGARQSGVAASWPITVEPELSLVLHRLLGWASASSWALDDADNVSRSLRVLIRFEADRMSAESRAMMPSVHYEGFAFMLLSALRSFGRYCSVGALDSKLDQWETLFATLPTPEQIWRFSIRETYRKAKIRLTHSTARRELIDYWHPISVAPELPSKWATESVPHRLKPYRTLRRIGEYCCRCLALQPRSERLPFYEPNVTRFDKMRDPYGDSLVTFLVGGLNVQWIYICRYEETVNALVIMIAIRRHLRDHGELPETLEELVPRYLAAVPLDPLVGGPWKYDRTRAQIWCGAVHPSEVVAEGPWFQPHEHIHQVVADPSAPMETR